VAVPIDVRQRRRREERGDGGVGVGERAFSVVGGGAITVGGRPGRRTEAVAPMARFGSATAPTFSYLALAGGVGQRLFPNATSGDGERLRGVGRLGALLLQGAAAGAGLGSPSDASSRPPSASARSRRAARAATLGERKRMFCIVLVPRGGEARGPAPETGRPRALPQTSAERSPAEASRCRGFMTDSALPKSKRRERSIGVVHQRGPRLAPCRQ
jgi:hypothetical protein